MLLKFMYHTYTDNSSKSNKNVHVQFFTGKQNLKTTEIITTWVKYSKEMNFEGELF